MTPGALSVASALGAGQRLAPRADWRGHEKDRGNGNLPGLPLMERERTFGPEGVAALRRLITTSYRPGGGAARRRRGPLRPPRRSRRARTARSCSAGTAPLLGDFQIFTANPDGTHQAQVLPGAAECPRWSPGGARILVCLADPGGLIRPATVRPNGSGFTLLETPDRTLNLGCWAWSPNSARLACEGWDDTNPNRPGRLHRAFGRRRRPGPRHGQSEQP